MNPIIKRRMVILGVVAVALALVLLLAGCGKTEVVYVDTPEGKVMCISKVGKGGGISCDFGGVQ